MNSYSFKMVVKVLPSCLHHQNLSLILISAALSLVTFGRTYVICNFNILFFHRFVFSLFRVLMGLGFTDKTQFLQTILSSYLLVMLLKILIWCLDRQYLSFMLISDVWEFGRTYVIENFWMLYFHRFVLSPFFTLHLQNLQTGRWFQRIVVKFLFNLHNGIIVENVGRAWATLYNVEAPILLSIIYLLSPFPFTFLKEETKIEFKSCPFQSIIELL